MKLTSGLSRLSWMFLLACCVYVGANDDDLQSDTAETPASHTPIILTKPTTVYVDLGKTAKLECKTEKKDPYNLVWNKGNDMLIIDESKMTNDERIQVEGSTLVIANVTEKDVGEYTCKIIMSKDNNVNIKHKLLIKTSQRDDASKATTEMKDKEMKSELTNESTGRGNGAPQSQLDQRAKMVAIMTVVILIAFF